MRPGVPAAALARSGRLPTGPGWLFEVKWDGFRAIACTHDGLRVRSRRRRDLTAPVPELAGLPDGLMLDGELVAWDEGRPSFAGLRRRLLEGDSSIPITYLIFDVLYVEGLSAMDLPYEERRALLEELDLRGPAWHVPCAFDDGDALYEVACERGLEGVVAKRRTGRYRPGERRWIKTSNPRYRRPGTAESTSTRRRSSARDGEAAPAGPPRNRSDKRCGPPLDQAEVAHSVMLGGGAP